MPTPFFDYATFLAGYRARCARFDVDPVEGWTSFQYVHFRAWRCRAEVDPNWWRDFEKWVEASPYRSIVEEAAFWNLFRSAFRTTKLATPPRSLHDIPLRELHARRGITLTWPHDEEDEPEVKELQVAQAG